MKKKKSFYTASFAVIVVAAVIYFLCNPLSAEEIEAMLPQNEWWSAAILLVLFVMKGFIPVILYAILVTACGALLTAVCDSAGIYRHRHHLHDIVSHRKNGENRCKTA